MNLSGLNDSGSSYASSSWRIDLGQASDNVPLQKNQKIPRIPNHNGPFRNKVPIIFVVFRGTMRNSFQKGQIKQWNVVWKCRPSGNLRLTNWCCGLPSHCLFHNSRDVNELVPVREVREAIGPNDVADLFMRLLYYLWMERHCHEEDLKDRNRL